jgi:hypothetical protein
VYQTFFHLLASDNKVVRSRFTKPPPVSLLPTLVSAFVATSYDDLYLPINLLAFTSCGSDIRASGCDRYEEIARSMRRGLLTDPSSQALRAEVPPHRGLRRVDPTGERLLTPASYQ